MAGPIFCIILVVDCLFFRFLEWFIPRDQLDLVDDELANGEIVFDRFVVFFSYRRNLLTELAQAEEATTLGACVFGLPGLIPIYPVNQRRNQS